MRKQGTQSQGSKGIAYDSRLPYLMRMDHIIEYYGRPRISARDIGGFLNTRTYSPHPRNSHRKLVTFDKAIRKAFIPALGIFNTAVLVVDFEM